MAASGQRSAAVEDAYVVQPKETALKEVIAVTVFTVHPPTEVQHQLGEGALEELDVAFSFSCLLRPVKEKRRPGVHWRVDVAEVPFVGRGLNGRMQNELLHDPTQLFSCASSVGHGGRHTS